MSQGHMSQLLGRPCDQDFDIRPWIVQELVVLLCHSPTLVPKVAYKVQQVLEMWLSLG